MLEKREYLLLFILIIAILLLTSGCGYYYPVVYTFGSIEITTNPSGAKIFFNGTNTGHITPYILTNIPMGSYIITLTLSGYLNSSNIVEVKANQISGINANLTPAP
jgi:PKD repeat protein